MLNNLAVSGTRVKHCPLAGPQLSVLRVFTSDRHHEDVACVARCAHRNLVTIL
jgi:hypothetical protein